MVGHNFQIKDLHRHASIMQYHHTQTAPLYLLLFVISVGLFIAAWSIPEVIVQGVMAISGALMFLLAVSFRELTVSDEGSELLISFGPLPVFRRRLKFAEIEKVAQTKSTIMDGWGIHMSPSGGWVWNLWGYDCVDVWYREGRKIRIGTDDAAGLAQFLQEKADQNGNGC